MKEIRFGLKNYWKMFKARGFLYPIDYFFQVRWFDIRRQVDTHLWVPKEFESEGVPNSDHGTIYMASRTTDIKTSFSVSRKLLGKRFKNFQFIDIGSGKGKVVLFWLELCREKKIIQKLLGIEYQKSLCEVANSNFISMFKEDPNELFVCADALDFDFTKLEKEIIVFLSNPFDRQVMQRLVENLQSKRVLVIYSIPRNPEVFITSGFSVVKRVENKWLGSDFDVLFLSNFKI